MGCAGALWERDAGGRILPCPRKVAGRSPVRRSLTFFRQPMQGFQPPALDSAIQPIVLSIVFCDALAPCQVAQALHVFVQATQASHLIKERIMKLQFGQNQFVLELSNAPFAWFHGQTERMSLTSLSLLFVQFSLFARQPAI